MLSLAILARHQAFRAEWGLLWRVLVLVARYSLLPAAELLRVHGELAWHWVNYLPLV